MALGTNLGSAYYKMAADLSELRSSVAEVRLSMAQIRSAVATSMSATESETKGAAGRISGVLKNAFSFAGGLAIANGASALFGGLKDSVIGLNASLETSKVAFATAFQGVARQRGITLDYATALQYADQRIKDLYNYAAHTPFEFNEVREAAQIMQTFGSYSAKNLKLVGDAAAGTSQRIQDVALWISRLNSDASAGEAIQNLTQLGVLTRKDLEIKGIRFDKAGAVLEQDVAKVGDTAARILNEKFAGGADKLSETFTGKLSTLKDNIANTLAGAGAPIFDKILKPGLDAINAMFDNPAFKQGLANVTDFIAKTVTDGVALFGQLGSALSSSGIFDALASVATGIGELIAGIINFVTTNQGVLDFFRNSLDVVAGALSATGAVMRGDFAAAGEVVHATFTKLGGSDWADTVARGFDRVKGAATEAANFLDTEVWPRFQDGLAKFENGLAIAGDFFNAWGANIARGWDVATNTIATGVANVADVINGNAQGTYAVLNNISGGALETARNTVNAIAQMASAATAMLRSTVTTYKAFSYDASRLGASGNLSSAEATQAAKPKVTSALFDAAKIAMGAIASAQAAKAAITPHVMDFEQWMGAHGSKIGAALPAGIGKAVGVGSKAIKAAKTQITLGLSDLAAGLRTDAASITAAFDNFGRPEAYAALDKATKLIEEKLKAMQAGGKLREVDVTPLLISKQAVIAGAIAEIERTGTVSEAVLARVKASLAGLGTDVQNAAVLQLRLLQNTEQQAHLNEQIGKLENERLLATSGLNAQLETANKNLVEQKALVDGTANTVANLTDDYNRANEVVAKAKGAIDRATAALQEQQKAQQGVLDGVNAEYDARRKVADAALAAVDGPLRAYQDEQDRKAAEFANRKLAVQDGGGDQAGKDAAIKQIEDEEKAYNDSQKLRGDALAANARVAEDDHRKELDRIQAEQDAKIKSIKDDQDATNKASQAHIDDLKQEQAAEQQLADLAKANLDAINEKQAAQTAAVKDTQVEIDGLNAKIKAVGDSYDALEQPLKGQLSQLQAAQPLLQEGIDKANTRLTAEQGVNDKLASQLSLIQKLVNETPDPTATYNKWHGLGEQAGQGYIDGIKSKTAGVAAAAAGNTQAGVDATKNTQKSASPSLVYAGLGDDAMEGYRGSIVRARGAIAAAVGSTIQAGVDAVRNPSFGLPGTGAGLQALANMVRGATGSLPSVGGGPSTQPVRLELAMTIDHQGKVDGFTDSGLQQFADAVTPHVGAAVMDVVGRILR